MMIATLLLGLTAVAAQAGSAASTTPAETITRQEAEARLAKCGRRRFESVAEFPVDGKMKRSRLSLCAADGETDAQWIATLEKNEASTKVETRIPESARFKLLSDLRAEIDRLKSGRSVMAVTGDISAIAPPKAAVTVPKSDFAIAALPALPVAKKGPNTNFDPKKAVAAPLTRRPQLSITCMSPGGAGARCTRMGKDTALEIVAEEDLASAVTLQFRRTDANREAQVRLAQLKRGDTVLMRVPAEICKGVVLAEFDVQLSGAGSGGMRYSDLVGPFEKRC